MFFWCRFENSYKLRATTRGCVTRLQWNLKNERTNVRNEIDMNIKRAIQKIRKELDSLNGKDDSSSVSGTNSGTIQGMK